MTDDLMRAMNRLAERGEPAGSRRWSNGSTRNSPVAPRAGRTSGAPWFGVARRRLGRGRRVGARGRRSSRPADAREFGNSGVGAHPGRDPPLVLPERLVVARRAVLAATRPRSGLLAEVAGSLWARAAQPAGAGARSPARSRVGRGTGADHGAR